MADMNRRIDMQTCRDHHEAIRILLSYFPSAEPFDPAKVQSTLQRLATVLVRHLRLEDEFLYPILEESDDRTVRETAHRYREEMGGLSAEFGTLLARWGQNGSIAASPAEFLDAWKPFRGRLEVRMAKEDNGLYAIADDYLTEDRGA